MRSHSSGGLPVCHDAPAQHCSSAGVLFLRLLLPNSLLVSKRRLLAGLETEHQLQRRAQQCQGAMTC